jgi:hypothetical protein
MWFPKVAQSWKLGVSIKKPAPFAGRITRSGLYQQKGRPKPGALG